MKKWWGILESKEFCEAETEEEAKRKMAEALIQDLQSGKNNFVVWPEANLGG